MSEYIISERIEDGYSVVEYSNNGTDVTGVVRERIPEGNLDIKPFPTTEELILLENQYQTALLEMNMMGGAV